MTLPPSANQSEPPPATGDGSPGAQRQRRFALLGLLLAAALAIYTPYKMYRMAWIRGLVGEAPVDRHVVAGKRQRASRSTVCLLSWGDRGAYRASTAGEVQADCDYWEHTSIGDTIEVVRAGNDLYLREGSIYTSTGNFVVDFGLLFAELAAVLYCARRLRRGGDGR